jgi:hypothetical protein
MFQTKVAEKIKKTIYEIMWKNMVKPDRRQMTIDSACALHAA